MLVFGTVYAHLRVHLLQLVEGVVDLLSGNRQGVYQRHESSIVRDSLRPVRVDALQLPDEPERFPAIACTPGQWDPKPPKCCASQLEMLPCVEL